MQNQELQNLHKKKTIQAKHPFVKGFARSPYLANFTVDHAAEALLHAHKFQPVAAPGVNRTSSPGNKLPTSISTTFHKTPPSTTGPKTLNPSRASNELSPAPPRRLSQTKRVRLSSRHRSAVLLCSSLLNDRRVASTILSPPSHSTSTSIPPLLLSPRKRPLGHSEGRAGSRCKINESAASPGLQMDGDMYVGVRMVAFRAMNVHPTGAGGGRGARGTHMRIG